MLGCARAFAAPAYVQSNASVPQSPVTSVIVPYLSAQTAGNLNVVAIGWSDSTSTVQSVTDTLGNAYTLVAGPTVSSGNATQAIYCASNIAGAAASTNALTVTFSTAVPYPDVRIAEYSGVDPASPLDVSVGAAGNDGQPNSGSATTTNANDLLVGADYVATSSVAGTGYTQRILTVPDSDIIEDQSVSATGGYAAAASLSPAGWWIMQLVALRAASGGPDTQPPTAPSGLTAATASSSQINLTWSPASDNLAVTTYLIERCAGSGCTGFAQIGTSSTTSFADLGLSDSATYTYRVRAQDGTGNVGGYSGSTAATTLASGTGIAYVQGASQTPQTPQSSVVAAYPSAQTAGNLNVVVIAWSDSTGQVQSVTDSAGNTYTAAIGPTVYPGTASQVIYFAKNIVASSSNSVTVTFSASLPYADVRIAEYQGLDTTSPLDVSVGNADSAGYSSSGSITTTHANDLLVAGNYVAHSATAAGSGYTERMIDGDSSLLEDQIVTSGGTYFATGVVSQGGWYVMQMVAFRAATGSGGGDTQPPSTPAGLSATAASSGEIDLTWSASTDNVGVTGYVLERCQGTSCSTFAQIATPATTSYSDTGLNASTSYTYRVRATDAAGNLGGYSATSSTTTSAAGGGGGGGDTQPPSAPTALSGTVVSGSEIDLTWSASTDNVGVTGYLIERCQGTSCTAFVQIATPTVTSYNDTGLTASIAYTYRLRATDAAGNLSAYSDTVSATTGSGSGSGGSATSTYTYDTQGRLQSVTTSSGIIIQYTYDAAGHVISIQRQ